MSGRSTQKVIKIDEGLWDQLDEWLKTDNARKIGYHSKAQFATEAVRGLLDKHKVTEISLSDELLDQLKKEYEQEIKKGQIKKSVNFEEYINERIKLGIRPERRTEYRT